MIHIEKGKRLGSIAHSFWAIMLEQNLSDPIKKHHDNDESRKCTITHILPSGIVKILFKNAKCLLIQFGIVGVFDEIGAKAKFKSKKYVLLEAKSL